MTPPPERPPETPSERQQQWQRFQQQELERDLEVLRLTYQWDAEVLELLNRTDAAWEQDLLLLRQADAQQARELQALWEHDWPPF